MPNVIKYSLFLLADLAIVGCIIHFGYSTLTVQGSIAADKLARRKEFPGTFDKLKLSSYFVAVFISFGLALYGSLIFLFSWIPHGNAEDLLGIGSVFGSVLLIVFLSKTQREIFLKLRFWQLRDAKEAAFQKLMNYELTVINLMLQRPEPEADTLVSLKHEIDEAEKSHTIYEEDAAVCRNLLNVFEAARTPLPAKSL